MSTGPIGPCSGAISSLSSVASIPCFGTTAEAFPMRSFHEIHRQHGDGGLTEGTQRRTLCLKVTQTAPFREVRPRAGVCGPRRKPPRSLPGNISGAFAQLGHFSQCPAAWRAVSPRLPCDCDVTQRCSLRDPGVAGRRARPGAAVPRPLMLRGPSKVYVSVMSIHKTPVELLSR